ncbi:MAG: DNA translocase FtsK [Chloroflexaceae bacterium]|nr:DNA translocase FtsK [Chloroflexaceae bacterium]
MSGKGSSRRTTQPTTSTRRRRSTSRRRSSPQKHAPTVRPEHQRELFALGLITIALVTLIFFTTDITGNVGIVYVVGMQQAFGSGALIVPLGMGTLGVVMLIQERIGDSPLQGSTLLGTFVVLLAILMLIEFPHHDIPIAERATEGGGIVGSTLVQLLDTAIGRPAALMVTMMLLLAGVLLMLNITLHDAMVGIATWMHQMRITMAGGDPDADEMEDESEKGRSTRTTRTALTKPAESQPQPAKQGQPTSAGLLRRGNVSNPPDANTARPAGEAAPAPGTGQKEPSMIEKIAGAMLARTTSDEESDTEKSETHAIVRPEVLTRQGIWRLPRLDLLDPPVETVITDDEHRVRARIIEETLASFKVDAQVVGVNTGPAVTQFEVQPAVGVKISRITRLEKDIALSLAAPSIRIQAPIPGKAVVGIEIPNSSIAVVGLRDVMDSEEFYTSKGRLKLPLGKDVSGIPTIADMNRMPHLLIAGSTGSGKSVAINAFLCGLLFQYSPDDLRMILIDPKMVELIVYNRIPHLLSPVVTKMDRVVPTLKWATQEMERRYKIFARHACRNLENYTALLQNRSDLEPMPYILIVIDELADLMMVAPQDVESHICRLAQMARATGIHLIIATQRPSVDVITGLIKANFPSRIAFAVTSQIDSRVILDTPGAEQLLGRGDMLYMARDAANLMRIQGTYVSDREVEQLVSFWRSSKPPAGDLRTDDTSSEADARPLDAPEEEHDPDLVSINADQPSQQHMFLSQEEEALLLPQAAALLKKHRRVSASMLQRRLNIEHSKAAQLIDLLEQRGLIEPVQRNSSNA